MVSAQRQHRPRRSGTRSFTAPTVGLKRRVVLAVLGAALIAECAAALVTSPLFRVRTITVNGLLPLLPQERLAVLHAVAPLHNANFFRFGGFACLKRIAAIPAVQSESIGRTLRCGLDVDITPRAPAAVLQGANGTWQVATSGLVIRKASSAKGAVLPVINAGCGVLQPGDVPAGSRLQSALLVLYKISSSREVRCSKITVDPDGNVWLNVLGTVNVNLGQPQHLNKKLAVLTHIVQVEPNIAAKVSLVDLTYPEQPACVPLPVKGPPSGTAGSGSASISASTTQQGLQ